MSVIGFPDRNDELWAVREARRAQRELDLLSGLRYQVIDVPADKPTDGTRGEWCALLDKPLAPRSER